MKPAAMRKILHAAADNRLALAIASRLTRHNPKIIMYHRFSAGQGEADKVPVEHFRAQMVLLARHFNVISLNELAAYQAAREAVPPRTVVITIDDGYKDFYDLAYPVLRELGLPATLFVTARFIDGDFWMWPDILRFILGQKSGSTIRVPVGDEFRDFSLGDERSIGHCWHTIADYSHALGNTERHIYIDKLIRLLDVRVPVSPTNAFQALSWEQLREIASSAVTVGAHSSTHAKLTDLSAEELTEEVGGCRDKLTEQLQQRVDHFCYPFGMPDDYAAAIQREVKAAGFRTACVAFHDGETGGPFELRRLGVSRDMRHFRRVVFGAELMSVKRRRH